MHTKLLCGLGSLALGIATFTASCTDRFVGCDKELTCSDSGPGGGGGMGGTRAAEGGGATIDPCDGACSGHTHVCLEGTCVACTDDDDCSSGFCDTESHECVQCREDAHCPATAPACKGGSCTGCATREDCEDVEGKTYCQESSGACVECVPGAHDVCGEGRLCHGELHECVDAEAKSAASCEPCVADAQCEEGLHCVRPDRFGEEGFYCLPAREDGCGDKRPFVQELEARTLVDGGKASVCGHRFTSCAGMNDFSAAVTGCSAASDVPPEGEGDAACGLPGAADNTRCRALAPGALCTFRCQGILDCPCGFACTGDSVCSFSYDEAHDCP